MPPVLLVGNEGVAYAAVVPPGVEVIRYQSFSLVNQPRADSKPLASLLAEAGLGAGAGRRRRGRPAPGGSASPAGSTSAPPTRRGRPHWIEAPAYLVSVVQALGCEPVNASAMFVRPGSGLRLVNDIDQIACFEFAAAHGSAAMRRMLLAVRPGMTEFDAFSLFQPIGLPFSYHPMVLSGERAALGLASPSGRERCAAATR